MGENQPSGKHRAMQLPTIKGETARWIRTSAPRGILDWLWVNPRYSPSDPGEIGGLTVPLVERKPKLLVGNRVIYSDGTVNSFVQRYLRERAL